MYIADCCDEIIKIANETEQRLDKGEITAPEAFGILRGYVTRAAIDVKNNALYLNESIKKITKLLREA